MKQCKFEKYWTNNDFSNTVQSCHEPVIGDGDYCRQHGCCVCGSMTNNNTKDWNVHLCDRCWNYLCDDYSIRSLETIKKIIDAAYESGRRGKPTFCTITIGGIGENPEPRYPCPQCGLETKEHVNNTRICKACKYTGVIEKAHE